MNKNNNLKHAILSASSSHRWLNCTPAPRLESEVENKISNAADEGTAAHNLGEYKLKKALNIKARKPKSKYDCDEMEIYTDDYANYVIEQYEKVKQTCKDPIILIEQKLDFSEYVPEGFGTGDCIIVGNGELNIIDLKYGKGIVVDAYDNPQMKLYALGAVELYDDLYDIKNITLTIFQPRRENISTFTITYEELMNWAENELREKAELAFRGEGEFKSGEWCTFCRVSPTCRKRAYENLKLAEFEFEKPSLLEDYEIEEIINQIPHLTKWADDIMNYVTDMAIRRGKKWQGYKVVEGRSSRKYIDEEQVSKVATDNGFNDIYKSSLIGIGDMEKLMGKVEFNEILGHLIHKPKGKLTLVPTSDKRQEVNIGNVEEEFKNTEEK